MFCCPSLLSALALIGPHSLQVPAPASFKNIEVAAATGKGMNPCEPSIAVSRKDPKNIVAGVILDRSFATLDGGKTWIEKKLTSRFGVYGDPTLISDKDGNFYYFHLASEKDTWLGRIVCQKSTDGGVTWTDGTEIGPNPPANQDKQWAVAHPTKPFIAVSWTQFDRYGSKDPKHRSNILFSLSRDAGATWSKALRVNEVDGDCLDGDDTTEGAVPAFLSDGTVCVAWSNGGKVYFDRSKDDGATWLAKDIVAAEQPGGWDMKIPGIGRCNGMPVLVADTSSGPNKDALYVMWADQRFGESDTDVFFARSTDRGDTWSKPLRVNKDGSGKQQFFPWMTIDPTTGHLYAVYYDRRATSDLKTDVYVAWSTDGGRSFKERKVSESPFTPHTRAFFGDYNNISAHNGVIAPIWTRMDEKGTSVWTAVIKHSDLAKP